MGDFDNFNQFVDDNITYKVRDVVEEKVGELKDSTEVIVKDAVAKAGDELKSEAKANLEDIKGVIVNEVIEIIVPFLIANAEGFFKRAGKAVVGFIGRNIGRLKFW